MASNYNLSLVLLSFVLAVFASYTALDLGAKERTTSGPARFFWLLGGSAAMGVGIWSMHFVAMLAFQLSLPVNYQVGQTLLSLVYALAASGLALWLLGSSQSHLLSLLSGGIIMGLAIASMHYTGMAAMQVQAVMTFNPWLVALSILIAVLASLAALWLAFYFQTARVEELHWPKIGSAVVMGLAISGMHYTGMAATSFRPAPHLDAITAGINPNLLATMIAVATVFLLALTLIGLLVEQNFADLQSRIHASSAELLKAQEAEAQLKHQHLILQSELSQASQYVRSLLPSPLHGQVDIEQYFLPSLQLGGDIFDYFWLDATNLVIYLLDVAGHGVRPALLSVSLHNLLRSQSLYNTNFYEPWTVLAELNRLFQIDEKGNDYFTLWYGVYNSQTRELAYACAAHPPALLLTSTSGAITSTQLSTDNIAIGLFPQFDFEQKFIPIEPDSTLYLFSDGVYEIPQSDGSIWGFEAFVDTVSQYHQNQNPNLAQIVNHVRQLNGNNPLDDDFSLIQLTFN